MSIQQPRRIDRSTVEHLLGPAPIDIHDRHPPLATLLTAAAAPGRPAELASEQASVAAFRTAQLTPVPPPRTLSAVKIAVMKVLTVKAVAVLAVTTAGGVALAAGTGTLPNPLARPAPVTSSGLSAAPPTAEQPPGEDGHSVRPTNSRSPRASKRPDASTAPSPSLVGLCHAYSAGNGAKRGKAFDNPAFMALITTAGGRDKVDRFCRALLAAQPPAGSDGRRDGQHDEDQRDGQHGPNGGGDNTDDRTARPSETPRR
jgi:hypothetical protein